MLFVSKEEYKSTNGPVKNVKADYDRIMCKIMYRNADVNLTLQYYFIGYKL